MVIANACHPPALYLDQAGLLLSRVAPALPAGLGTKPDHDPATRSW